MANILLTGASGFLGWHFCRQFSEKHTIHGLYFRHLPEDIPLVNWHKQNLMETAGLEKLVSRIQPDCILHLAAISKPAFCEQHPTLSHHINVYSSQQLVDLAKKMDIPMLYTSTDLVFNGSSAPYTEDDFCYPISQYGIQKQTAEECVLESCEKAYVVRIPLQFGWAPDYTSNFFKTSILQLQEGESIKAFTDEYRTALSAYTTAQWIEAILHAILYAEKVPNVMHIGSHESLSRFELMMKVADVFQLDHSLILPTLQSELNLSPPRPADVSLDIGLALQTIDFSPPSIEDQINQLKKDV